MVDHQKGTDCPARCIGFHGKFGGKVDTHLGDVVEAPLTVSDAGADQRRSVPDSHLLTRPDMFIRKPHYRSGDTAYSIGAVGACDEVAAGKINVIR